MVVVTLDNCYLPFAVSFLSQDLHKWKIPLKEFYLPFVVALHTSEMH